MTRHGPTQCVSYTGIVLRSTLFNVLFYLNVIGLMLIAFPVLAMNRHATLSLARTWSRSSLWLLRTVCGTTVEFRGLQNIPARPALIAPKHQSILETMALTIPIADFSYVLKRELTWIPFFGWYLWSAQQIAINRSSGRTALVQVLDAAQRIFAQGRSLFLFPEGTRRPVDAPPAYKGGVAQVYEAGLAPCLPVALNTGLFWPRRSFLRFPGRCVIEFLPPIAPGLSREDFMTALQNGVETATGALVAQARAESPWLQARTIERMAKA